MQPMSPLRTSAEAASALTVDRATVTRWVQSGRLVPALKLPGLRGAYMFTDEAIELARVASVGDPESSTGRRRFRAAERCHATFGVPIDVDRPDSQISRTLAVR